MHVNKFIDKMEEELPDLCTAKVLITYGIFSSVAQSVIRRSRGEKPEFLKLSKKRIVYPKSGVISWLREQAEVSKPSLSSSVRKESES